MFVAIEGRNFPAALESQAALLAEHAHEGTKWIIGLKTLIRIASGQ
jgi:hypothetical protein